MADENGNEQPQEPADAVQGSGDEQNPPEGGRQDADDPAAQLEKLQRDVEKWKSLARKHEGNAKSNSDAARRLAEIEDSQKTEQQRLNDKLAAAEVQLAQYRTREVRTAAAAEAGLSPEFHEFITEVEPEAALEQARRLAARLQPATPTQPDFMQGARTRPQPATDPNAWLRQAAGLA
jgi:hypothetical protein